MPKFDYNLIQGLKGNTNVTADFITAVEGIAGRLETKPEYLLAAMSFETGGSFSPSITNPIGATGLIQFLKSTAQGLGTTTATLRAMTSVEQLEFVEKYFKNFAGKVGTLEAVYTAILSGSPKKPDHVLFTAGTLAYKQNPLDWNRDGIITAREATTPVAARLFGGVKAVQRRLLDLGFVPDELKEGFDDGTWGKNTTDVLAKFQESKGLEITGLMDEASGKALFSLSDDHAGTEPQPVEETAPLEHGAEGDAVKKLQDGFVDLGYMSTEKIGTGYGKFGPQTKAAVEAFQKDLGLEITGKFGEVEQRSVKNIRTGIGKGDPNTQMVKAIQDQLVHVGFMTQAQVNTGHGIFGNQTQGAVKNLQGENQIPQSGVVEAVTFKLLFNETDAKQDIDIVAGKSGEHYTSLPKVLITDEVEKKINRVANLYFQKTGQDIIVTSGYRPPARQAPAMYDKIVSESELRVRNLYKNKIAIDQILNAYRKHKGNRDAAIAAMIETIEKQVKNGVFISSHLLSNAIDVRLSANKAALKAAVEETGGRMVPEKDHYHLELR